MTNDILVPLINFTKEELQRDAERFEAFKEGGGGYVVRKEIILEHVKVSLENNVLHVSADHNGHDESFLKEFEDAPRRTVVEGTCNGLSLPQSWKGYDYVKISITNGDKPLSIEGMVVGTRGRLIEQHDFNPLETATITIDLIDLPLAQGLQDPFMPTGIRIAVKWDGPHENHNFSINEIKLEASKTGKIRPSVDRFGQRINASWPGKIYSEEQLKNTLIEEEKLLKSLTPLNDRSMYGGLTNGDKFEATGFFRVDKDSHGRWWYIDPLGFPFWSSGCTGVRYRDDTDPTGREFLFEELPPKSGVYEKVWHQNCIRLYAWNIIRKFGDFEKWRSHVLKRFKAWGYNTIANWSAHIMYEQQEVAFTVDLNTAGPKETCLQGSFYDVFNPKWNEWFNTWWQWIFDHYKTNPWLLGYFVDNEKAWERMNLLNCPSTAHFRAEWLKLVQSKFTSISDFNSATNNSFSSWDEVQKIQEPQLPKDGIGKELREAIEDIYAEAYFSKIYDLIKKNDKNHLYLGCRFTKVPPRDSIVKISAKYSDVVSVNCYSLIPERAIFQKWHDLSGKPIQMGEHQLSLYDRRQLPPTWTAFSAKERQKYYIEYDKAFASMPFAIGSHWFQFTDQCVTGRPSNGENQMIGIVDITDQPHEELVEAIRTITSNMYNWHLGSGD